MNCPYDINDAYAFLGGSMESPDKDHFESRMSSCPHCASLMEDAQSARQVWMRAEAPDPSASDWTRMEARLMERVRDEEAAPAAWLAGLGRSFAFAGAALVLAIGGYASYRAMSPAAEPGPVQQPTQHVAQAEVGQVLSGNKDGSHARVADAALTLAPAAACQVKVAEPNRTVIEMLAGAVTFSVDKRAPGASFEVTAGDVTVTVVGTRFTVTLTDGEVMVSVDEGVVAVQRGEESMSTLREGDAIKVAPQRVAMVQKPTERQKPEVVEPVQPEIEAVQPEVVEPVQPEVVEPVQPEVEEPEVAEQVQPEPEVKRAPKRSHKTKRAAVTPEQVEPKQPEAVVILEDTPPVVQVDDDQPVVDDEPVEVVKVESEKADDPARAELKTIFRAIGSRSYTDSILGLEAWLQRHPSHTKRVAARYAIGYCEFKRGNKKAAQRIFSRLPPNPWIKTVGDQFDPPKPR